MEKNKIKIYGEESEFFDLDYIPTLYSYEAVRSRSNADRVGSHLFPSLLIPPCKNFIVNPLNDFIRRYGPDWRGEK